MSFLFGVVVGLGLAYLWVSYKDLIKEYVLQKWTGFRSRKKAETDEKIKPYLPPDE